METKQALTQFRHRLYRALPARRDSVFDLIDAMCSNTRARSVVELSLEPAFRRGHSSVYDAIDTLFSPTELWLEWAERCALEKKLRRVVGPLLNRPSQRKFWMLGVDAFPLSRPHARCLHDRGWVYQPEAVPGKLPVTIGHKYSLLVGFPERTRQDPVWTLPLSVRRIATNKKDVEIGVEQARAVLDDPKLPWHDELAVLVGDSGYGNAEFIGSVVDRHGAVVLTRLRSSRVLYRQPPERPAGKRGRGRWYGARFSLNDPADWTDPDQDIRFCPIDRPKEEIRLRVFSDMLMRGKRDLPMHQHPMTLIRVDCFDAEGKPRRRGTMWLSVCGARRDEITIEAAFAAYRQRFDQEQGHRFVRRQLLMDRFQTTETEHEENWMMLVGLAHAQLFAARQIAQYLPQPWEPKKTASEAAIVSPSMTQRAFSHILAEIGTPARPPKPRGKASGRPLGHKVGRRHRFPVVKKARKRRQKALVPT